MSHDVALKSAVTNTVDAIVDNILSVYAKATEQNKIDGTNWYLEANSFACELAIKHNVSVEKTTAVIAHLSPRLSWMRNKKAAVAVFNNESISGVMDRNIAMAVNAIDSDDPISTLNGPKVKAFADNILGNTQRVTVDVWALRIAFGTRDFKDSWLSRKGAYDAIEYAYQLAAAKVGIEPSTLQAITWVVIRNGRAN